jgi:hypothetical protein
MRKFRLNFEQIQIFFAQQESKIYIHLLYE